MAIPTDSRPDPEELLRQVMAEERRARRGQLKVFLGYTSRVGKSYRMLDEGRRRAMRGADVVVGAVQQRNPPEVEAVLRQLEVIPMPLVAGTPVMDVNAILRRQPAVCLMDGLAFANPAGHQPPQRWQEAETLLEAGITVIATLNLQFIAERRAAVELIIGRAPLAAGSGPLPTVPEEFLRTADEIEVVDAPPASSAPGNIRQLTELREIALLLAADVVDRQLETYVRRHGIGQIFATHERILLCLSTAPAHNMIASGRRNAERFHGELIAVHVAAPGATPQPDVEANLHAAAEAGAELVRLEASDCVAPILRLARERAVTQIFVDHGRKPPSWAFWRRGVLDRLIGRVQDADIRVFPHEAPPGGSHGGD